MKLNVNLAIKIGATVLGVASTLMSSVSQQKVIEEAVKKEVEKALANK